MAGFLAAVDAEFLVRCTRLPRFTPFPSWNGVIACGGRDGIVSILSECGRVYLLRLTVAQAFEFEDSLCAAQILESDTESIMSMCQAWTRSGEVLVVARDRHLTIYRRTDKNDEVQFLEPVATVLLRFAATTVDVVEEESGGLLLVVGCVAGVMVYSVSSDRKTEVSSLGSFMDTVAVAVVKFSLDKEYLAIGTIDGRAIILRRIGQQAFSVLDSPETVIKVLAAPRVTSLTFSPASDKLIATTRKGNVYVFTRESHQWTLDASFESLIANPKGGATSQTLSCWWGAQTIPSTPILTIAAKSASCNLELYDVRSRSRLHTLQLGSQRPGADGLQESADRHIMGIVSVPTSDAPRLVAIDSDAIVSIIAWPFLAYACPR